MHILGSNKKISFEGEGPRLGLKTLLFCYTGEGGLVNIDPKDNQDVLAIYVTTDILDTKLLEFLVYWEKEGKLITLDTTKNIPSEYSSQLFNTLFFRQENSFKENYVLKNNEYIKLEAKTLSELDTMVDVANKYCAKKEFHTKVMLMPILETSCLPDVLMSKLEQINGGVRFMPPIQNILQIP